MVITKALVVVCVLLPLFAQAEQVVAFVNGTKPPPVARKAYLLPAPRDEGYVSLTAEINNPSDVTCIAPAENTFFADRKLDVTITAQVFGFFGVDSSKEIPIATYQWSGSRYCRTSWRRPVLLVPPTPIGLHENVGEDEPYIVLRLRSSSSTTEKVSTFANALLGLGATYATGGAANTVVGLSKIAGGPAEKFLSDSLNAELKGEADQTTMIEIPWQDIAGGVQPAQVQMVSKEVEIISYLPPRRETIAEATAALTQHKAAGQVLLTVNFRTYIKRSLFTDDATLGGNNNPQVRNIGKYAVLNYPRKFVAGENEVPTLFQRINAQAPSLFIDAGKKESDDCDRLLVTVKDLGFNAVDRAIVVGAVLDAAVPNWRANRTFRQLCLHSEQELEKRLIAMDQGYFPTPPSPVFIEPELTTNPPDTWMQTYSAYMSNLRLALFSKDETRAKKLKGLLGDTVGEVAGQVDASLDVGTAAGALDPRSDDFLKDLVVTRAGCIFGFFDTQYNELHSAFLFGAKDKNHTLHPYLFIVEHQRGPGPQPVLSARTLWIKSMDEQSGRAFTSTLENARFSKGSVCYRGDSDFNPERSLDDVLEEFRK